MPFEPPPVPGHHPQLEDFRRFASQVFGERVFAERYGKAFDWFAGAIPAPQALLNIGCSSGRETLAVQWALHIETAHGLDINRQDIGDARRVCRYIRRFNRRFYRQILHRISEQEVARRLRNWYEKELPPAFREDRLPTFYQADLTRRIPLPPASVDLVYGRYVLFQIVDTQPADVPKALRNIRRVLRPAGHLALVEPTRREALRYHFEDDFQAAGFRMVKTVPAELLDFLEWPPTQPAGYLLQRLAS